MERCANPQKMRIAIAQINTTVGDLAGNAAKIIEFSQRAAEKGADLVIFPELAITGYPPEDLLLKPQFISDNLAALQKVKDRIKDIIAIVGFVDRKGKDIFNAAAIIYKGRIYGVYHKQCLPNYGVFDEKRYFKAGDYFLNFRIGDYRFSILICEDAWEKEPIECLAKSGAQMVLDINASPYHMGKLSLREKILREKAKENQVLIAYVNLVGGQDELIFDGGSLIIDSKGKITSQAPVFKEDLLIRDVNLPRRKLTKKAKEIVIPKKIIEKKELPGGVKSKVLSREEEVYSALTLGLKDYVLKNNFKKVVIGLSGGVDSALTAAIASDALGKENTIGVFMPSQFSSMESLEDAEQLAKNLGIDFKVISIQDIFETYKKILAPVFADRPANVAEENIQARIRGNLLMALSNKFGWLVLTTGNKSEYSCGYATLYGDMAGGFAVIKDVPKTLIFSLAKYRNHIAGRELIPPRIITKEPSAELRPNQKDSDSLPPYDILDKIIADYVEENKSREQISKNLSAPELVGRAIHLIDSSEYKRRQSPPGIKITQKAFGKDRRMPITNRYRD
jgi:NAD+ synthase (glutamine-hydrolysing)